LVHLQVSTSQTLNMKEKPNGGFSWPESERSSER